MSVAPEFEKLLGEIEQAFADEHFQKPVVNLVYSTDYDDSASLNLYLHRRHWKEITYLDLSKHYQGVPDELMSYTTSAGFAYCIPAIMVIAIKEAEIADVLPDYFLFALSESKMNKDNRMKERDEALEHLNTRQLKIVQKFIRLYFTKSFEAKDKDLALARLERVFKTKKLSR